MNIITAYKTSRGIFLDVNEASKKQNRSKEYGSRPGDPIEYEDVKSIFVIQHEDKFFELNEVSVK